MTKYIVKLSEQEEMNLRHLMGQPGSEVIFKLLQGESLDAQTAAMECTDPDEKKRLLVLTDAQATARVVSNLIRKLAAYQQSLQPEQQQSEVDEIMQNLWERTAN